VAGGTGLRSSQNLARSNGAEGFQWLAAAMGQYVEEGLGMLFHARCAGGHAELRAECQCQSGDEFWSALHDVVLMRYV
jgi:hypothetical protein